ncbi:uncharacterized protein LTR77_001930 [Saxophila tyrrhenica]|uniref:Uncharacterized protein n=1 Tax=Saxophila tyrrhenica TaxID=1690608 RepID=A0AAV9PH35_9PEZI|nr:hypothetical protein LTR77_001930 [Saxophila tyrrhenica]
MSTKPSPPLQSRRPVLHVTVGSWLNDPCAPSYDAHTDTYHLFHQTNPSSTQWGNMSWAHLTSADQLTWTPPADTETIALHPDQPYDCKGVFTGCWVPPSSPTDHTLRVIYSSVKHLPFHWSTPPYPRNAAGLAIATSQNGGRTWQKEDENPILRGEPECVEVTGFRDPYLAAWPAMDRMLGREEPSLYGLVSGGIRGRGPTTFVYEVPPDDPTSWKLQGDLVEMPERFQPSHHWSGNYGLNWECVNFMTLTSGEVSREVLIIGAEGDVEKQHLWMSGPLVEEDGTVRMEYSSGGYLDHGTYYAANSFVDPKTGRRIVHGWIPEEDISAEFVERKGWNGSLAIPREVFLVRIFRVVKALRSEVPEISGFEQQAEADGSLTLTTLGVRPIHELTNARERCRQKLKADVDTTSRDQDIRQQTFLFEATASTWDLEVTMDIHLGCKEAGLFIHHDEKHTVGTAIVFSLEHEAITVDRSRTNTVENCNRCPEKGPFTLFTTAEKDEEPVLEKLRLRIISDGDVLEVFANDRFALATMVYREEASPSQGGITAFASGAPGSTVVGSATLWDGIGPT